MLMPNFSNFDTLKEAYNTYKNKVSVISLFDESFSEKIDTVSIKKKIADYQIGWEQGFCDIGLADELMEKIE